VSGEVAYLRARYEEEAETCRRTQASDLDYLPTLQCRCGRRIYIGPGEQQCAEVIAKMKILDFHEQWPVLLETPATVEMQPHVPGEQWAAHLSMQVGWVTTQQYRARFGDEPPTSPIIRALLQVYAYRHDFDPAWRDA
jgi:hypothetical protein